MIFEVKIAYLIDIGREGRRLRNWFEPLSSNNPFTWGYYYG